MDTLAQLTSAFTPQLVAALVLAALLTFWMIGAHNRLVGLRNQVGQAWGKVDDALRQRSAAADALLSDLREPMAAEAGALDAWQTALADAARAAVAMAAKPLVATNATVWVGAEVVLAASASRVFALLEQHHALRQQQPLAGHVLAWRDTGTRLVFARQLFNDAADAYNAALAMFPTRLLVRMFHFEPAGRI